MVYNSLSLFTLRVAHAQCNQSSWIYAEIVYLLSVFLLSHFLGGLWRQFDICSHILDYKIPVCTQHKPIEETSHSNWHWPSLCHFIVGDVMTSILIKEVLLTAMHLSGLSWSTRLWSLL